MIKEKIVYKEIKDRGSCGYIYFSKELVGKEVKITFTEKMNKKESEVFEKDFPKEAERGYEIEYVILKIKLQTLNFCKELMEEKEKEIKNILNIFQDDGIYAGRIVKFEIRNRLKKVQGEPQK